MAIAVIQFYKKKVSNYGHYLSLTMNYRLLKKHIFISGIVTNRIDTAIVIGKPVVFLSEGSPPPIAKSMTFIIFFVDIVSAAAMKVKILYDECHF